MSADVHTFLRTRPARRSTPPVLWAPHDDGFERAIVFEPGFGMDPDERSKPASQRYGRHSMQMRWLLRGPRGVAQFLMSTGWTPEPAPADPRRPGSLEWMTDSPSAWDMGYPADPVLAAFFDRGEVAVWEALREVHDGPLTEAGDERAKRWGS